MERLHRCEIGSDIGPAEIDLQISRSRIRIGGFGSQEAVYRLGHFWTQDESLETVTPSWMPSSTVQIDDIAPF